MFNIVYLFGGWFIVIFFIFLLFVWNVVKNGSVFVMYYRFRCGYKYLFIDVD